MFATSSSTNSTVNISTADIATAEINANFAKKCIVCCDFVLQKFNLHSLAYSNLFLAYKFVLTLSSSQVACERSFSKLKYILNRLRNLLSQSSLQSFMLMSCEKDLLPRINNNEIIDFLASTSETMKKLL